MPWIKFVETPKIPDDWAHLRETYVKGAEVEVSASHRDRWIGRGVAVEIAKPGPKAKAKDADDGAPSMPPAVQASSTSPAAPSASTSEFDPSTASISDVRAFLRKNGSMPGPNTSDAKLREVALDILTRA